MKEQKRRILVVDDEIKIVEVVKSYLQRDGYSVYSAYDGNTVMDMFDKVNPDLMILDLMLPDICGEKLCSILRKKSKVPIIMLTAKTSESDILNGFDIGADDYVIKPFSPKQLVARVKSLLRRTVDDKDIMDYIISIDNGRLTINNSSYEVKKSGSIVNLTPVEYNILTVMAGHPEKIFTREELISIVLGKNFDGYNRAIDSHIKNLRQKIEDNSRNPVYILTVRGIGYKFGGIVEKRY
ncbi:MAG: response regulator transcription factor [Clostridium sp.]|jgi:DNA-binding response OmpR family regulator|uniref:response regulator transcription factor n=1 Tax=Clostridium sp. TaxID=1506 RepID=UPI0025C15962|nr:response regulator transcription factor [Clostridium sp.]MCH3963698.1 response regulator transcription factor [Clostridium sp.]MCI1714839.1 response regulator transcription factor [Clostridium sp.]MCI1798972.1 response regulator transcription factor [Clostridium sp.]MCI1813022.1 response regulator transcription factor [Clostridium sp.]MCI1869912.1 response regulator transcription factor [Clostridium sp.]